jgi:hypothetical protein
LQLVIEWPVAKGTLELIGSNNNPIESLFLRHIGLYSINFRRLANLNLSMLGRLTWERLGDKDIKRLFDLVMKSNPQDLKLIFKEKYVSSKFEFFTHKMLQRVVDFKLDFGQ